VQCCRLEREIYRAAEVNCKQAAQAWRGAFANSLFDIAPPSLLACELQHNCSCVSQESKAGTETKMAQNEAFQRKFMPRRQPPISVTPRCLISIIRCVSPRSEHCTALQPQSAPGTAIGSIACSTKEMEISQSDSRPWVLRSPCRRAFFVYE
jgi:hypothetical protein